MRTIALTAALIAATVATAAPDATHDLRVAKARAVVSAGYSYGDERDFLPYVGYLVTYHEQLERDALAKKKPAEGYASAYWWTLVYGGSNFGLRCYRRAPGACVGPLDVKGKRGSIDPHRNIQLHCQEMLEGYLRGYRDLGLCRYVMYPARPHDWGYAWCPALGRRAGRFERTDLRHRTLLGNAYRAGEIGGQ